MNDFESGGEGVGDQDCEQRAVETIDLTERRAVAPAQVTSRS
jgi:hypothetical protein